MKLFSKNRPMGDFKVVRNIIDVDGLFDYSRSVQHNGILDDPQTPGAPSVSNDTEMWKLQIRLLPAIEAASGHKLYPTYNFFRVYNSSSYLKKHIDRAACEISASLNLGYEGDYSWPLWIEDSQGKAHEVVLEPGDAMIYRGTRAPHWREPADERVICQSQLFVHYVDQDGPNADCILDRQPDKR